MGSNEAFWRRAHRCKHVNAKDTRGTRVYESCMTPLCGVVITEWCPRCHVYLSSCDCHSSNGMSGWSPLRWRRYLERRRQRLAAKMEA